VLIRIWIHSTHPLAGMAATEGNDPQRFDGGLELLRVISDLVVADAPARETQTGRFGGD
jgi:hypothetical protein